MRRGAMIAWVVGLTGALSAAGWLFEMAHRPSFFTVGGVILAEGTKPASLGPRFWKRDCHGIAWWEGGRNDGWMACAGWPHGLREAYRDHDARMPWAPAEIPNEVVERLEALTGRDGIRQLFARYVGLEHDRLFTLAWRNTRNIDEVLTVAKHGSSWKLSRVCMPERLWEKAGDFYDRRPWIINQSELQHQPSNAELAEFILESGWSETNLHPRIDAWGLTEEAWALATGEPRPRAYLEEVARLRSYVFPELGRRNLDVYRDVEPAVRFVLKPGKQALLPESAASIVAQQCSRGGVPLFEATWTPPPSVILELEEHLPSLASELYDLMPDSALCGALRGLNLNDFHLQYSGMIERGRYLIYINAWAGQVDDDWRKVPHVVCDGGYGAWGVVYDVATQTFHRFSMNGFA